MITFLLAFLLSPIHIFLNSYEENTNTLLQYPLTITENKSKQGDSL